MCAFIAVAAILISVLPLSATALTVGDRNTLLTTHNLRRSLVSPTASNMLLLEWDSALEAIAQSYANQCVRAHNANRGTLPIYIYIYKDMYSNFIN